MNFLKIAVVILFLLSTVVTVKIRPEIHQPMLLEDADFKLTRISDTVETIPKAVVASKPVVTSNSSVTNIVTTAPKQKTKKVQPTQSQNRQIKTENVKIQPVQTDKSQLELLQRIIKNTEEKPIELNQPTPQPTTQSLPKKQEQPKQIVKEVKVEPQTTNKNPYMTEQEEIIAWNKWRSKIHNEIMDTSKGVDTAPIGTAFLFTFLVDKYGNVSNIKVECSNPNLMDLTRNSVKPAIANLHRKSILQFPKGTQRTSTVVTGVFLIGTENRYSTPNDFPDFERITY